MTLMQIIMLAASAFFAYKIYEHINTLKEDEIQSANQEGQNSSRSMDAFSTADAQTLIERGDEAMQEESFDKALAIYSEANIKEPNNDETLFKMGYTLAKQKRYDEALEYFQDALDIDKENPFTHLEMGNIYKINGEFASARNHYNAALELEPELEAAKEALENLHKESRDEA